MGERGHGTWVRVALFRLVLVTVVEKAVASFAVECGGRESVQFSLFGATSRLSYDSQSASFCRFLPYLAEVPVFTISDDVTT